MSPIYYYLWLTCWLHDLIKQKYQYMRATDYKKKKKKRFKITKICRYWMWMIWKWIGIFKQNKIHLLKNKTYKESQCQQQPKHKKSKKNKKINLNKTKTFGKKTNKKSGNHAPILLPRILNKNFGTSEKSNSWGRYLLKKIKMYLIKSSVGTLITE